MLKLYLSYEKLHPGYIAYNPSGSEYEISKE